MNALDVMSCAELERDGLAALCRSFGLLVREVGTGSDIPGSFWGGPEAGLIHDTLFVRADTPAHSALHETGHWLCMSEERRANLHTDAGGDELEECAVCYLQVLLADRLPGYGRERLFADMDRWGYSFRLGSARRWFYADAEDARGWLLERALVDDADMLLAGMAAGADSRSGLRTVQASTR